MQSNILVGSLVLIFATNFLLFNKLVTLTFSSFLNGQFHDTKIHLLSNGSGYYVTGGDSSGRANIWKYKENTN